MPPNAAFPPASENGVDATAVPNTLAFFGAPNAAKSVTTFRGGEPDENVGDDDLTLLDDVLDVPGRAGR